MESDNIQEIGIDENSRLFIKPETKKFPLIYRTATEVHWDNNKNVLYSPKPREWTYFDWYRHIVSTLKMECGCKLKITPETLWISIPKTLEEEIRNN
jgi:hypothetical protein